MKAERSATQILFGYLPGQTVDLHGGIWKVTEWRTPRFIRIDQEALRSELIRVARPWEATDNDGGFVRRLRAGDAIRAVSVDLHNGVLVQRFPEIWQCRVCNRIPKKRVPQCSCGAKSWGQLHFVGYHSCGELTEPWIPRCRQHDDVKLIFPGSSDASQIKFVCPACSSVLRQGFGFPECSCGKGRMTFNVHRASSVFTPRSVAIVNAMSEDKIASIRAQGGPERALAWVLNGMPAGGLANVLVDLSSLVEDLVSKGIDRTVAEKMANVGALEGAVAQRSPLDGLTPAMSQRAVQEAVTIVSAVSESRLTVQNLIDRTAADDPLGRLYRNRYPMAVRQAGLEAVELIDRFPVLTGHFGYTRGDADPGQSRLRTWRDPKYRQQVVYADLQETEALFLRLDPVRVLTNLRTLGHDLPEAQTAEAARRAILERVVVPQPGEEPTENTAGVDLLRLVHSYAHRFIRQAAVFAGLDRNSLSELLVPTHLGIFVYAAARGDFVLGGLQAVFESDLDRLLGAVLSAEHRCAMDPGCAKTGGACVACLHLGEPSCRYFNRLLDRRALVGQDGYLSARASRADRDGGQI
jgi:hypothetical protein